MVLVSTPAHGVRLFTSGFETNNLTATEWSGNMTTAPTLQSATVHSGTYASEVSTSSAAEGQRRSRSASISSGTLFLRTYFRCSTFPNSVTTILATRASGAGANAMLVRFVNSSNVIRLRNSISTTESTGNQALTTGVWYRIEARHLIADAGGEMEVRLYQGESTSALETLTITNEDTLPTNIQDFDFGFQDATTGTCYFDDIAINDATGSFQTSWAGPGKIFRVTATGNDTVAWTRTGANCSGTTNTDCVDDMGTPDDLSGYNTIGTSGTADRFNKTGLGAEIPSDADMILIDVYARFGASGSTGTRLCRVDLWDENGSQSSGPDTGLGCDGTADTFALMSTLSHLVFDLGARSKATVDDPDFDIGYTNRSAHDNRVTAVWANVEWIDATAVTTKPRRRLVVW